MIYICIIIYIYIIYIYWLLIRFIRLPPRNSLQTARIESTSNKKNRIPLNKSLKFPKCQLHSPSFWGKELAPPATSISLVRKIPNKSLRCWPWTKRKTPSVAPRALWKTFVRINAGGHRLGANTGKSLEVDSCKKKVSHQSRWHNS